jgi:flavodoxin/ferredoxin
MTVKSVAILYFSGTGGTRLVAELLGEILSARFECGVLSIEDSRAAELAAGSGLLVLLYPTYYLKPAPSMSEFVQKLGPLDPPRAAYVVSTCELYSENSIRRLGLSLRKRGALVAGSKVLRAPGSDLTCVLPSALIPWWYRFERGLPEKLRAIAEEIGIIAESRGIHEALPRPKWYTPFTQIAQILFLNRFDGYRSRMRVLRVRCGSCGACVARCGRGAWEMGGDGPVHLPERCELCTRCLHLCPKRAIVLIGALKDNRRLDSRLYGRLREEAGARLGLGRGEGAK